MSVNEAFKCIKCNRNYNVDYSFMLYPDEDSSIREKVLSGAYFKAICPHCNNPMLINHRFIYNDRENSFLIINELTEGRLLESRAMVFNRLKEELGDLALNYRIYGSRNPLEAINAIIFYENNLDIKYAYLTIYQLLAKLNEDNDDKYINASPEYDKDSKLIVRANRKSGRVDRYEFPMDLYEIVKEFFKDKLEGYNDFLFNYSSAVAIFNAGDDEELSSVSLCALARSNNDDVLLLVPEFLKKDIKLGASVNYLNNGINNATIKRLLDIKSLSIANTTASLPIILNINTDSINIEGLKEFKPSDLGLYLKDNDIINTLSDDELLLSNVYVGAILSQNEKTRGLEYSFSSDNANRLILYLDKEAVAKDNNMDYYIPVVLRDILGLVVRMLDKYDGIVIKGSDIADIKANGLDLINLKYQRYRANSNLLVELLNSLTDAEINYIFPEVKEILLMRYRDSLEDEAIAKAFDISIEELNSVYENANLSLMHISLNKYYW